MALTRTTLPSYGWLALSIIPHFSTTMDYARFAQMLLNKGELDGVRLLSPASVALMATNAVPDDVLAKGAGGFNRARASASTSRSRPIRPPPAASPARALTGGAAPQERGSGWIRPTT